MPIFDIDVVAGKESKAVLKEVNRFAAKLMRPAGIELDRMEDISGVIKKGSDLWGVFTAYRKLGLHLPFIPEDLGGMGEADKMTGLLVAERLGAADIGLAISLMAGDVVFQYAALFPVPTMNEIAKQYCEDLDADLIGALPVVCPDNDPANGNCVNAAFQNGHYVLNGEEKKVMNGGFGTHIVLTVNVTEKKEPKGRAIAIVPLDRPGVFRGLLPIKSAQRTLNQANLTFHDVKLPKGFLVKTEPEVLAEIKRTFSDRENQFVSAAYGGLALAAWEEAAKYAKGRVQGGMPIFFHKNIQLQLFNMFKKTEAARASARRLALFRANGPGPVPGLFAAAAKCLATETAAEVASEAIQIFGGYGLAKEFPVEKMFRDARMGMIEHGVNEDIALAAMAAL